MNILGILIAILVLGILILVHELGHYLLAKATGIAVDEFAIGFGKELIGWQRGETRYRINMIPLGGYCKMRGEESKDRKEKEADKDKEKTDQLEITEKDPHAMFNRPAWARVLAILGGPVFNYLFAVLLFSLLFMFGLKEERQDFTINVVTTNTVGLPTPAVKAGLKDGDFLVSINNKSVVNYGVLMEQAGMNANVTIPIIYIRNGVTNKTTITPEKHPDRGLGYIGVYPEYTPVVGMVYKNSPADKAGVKIGDRILSVNDTAIKNFYDMAIPLSNSIGKPTSFLMESAGEQKKVVITPEEKEGGVYLGMTPNRIVKRYAKNFFNAFALGFKEANVNLSEKIWTGLKTMFSGNIDVQKNISGPIRIVQITGKVAMYRDFNRLIQFMALISVALGFFNLLPIPGLDGAHFLINTFEMVTTIKPNEKVMVVVEYVGFVMIIILSVLVFFNDIFNIVRDLIRGQ